MTPNDSVPSSSRRQMIGLLGSGIAAAPMLLATGDAFAKPQATAAAAATPGPDAAGAPTRPPVQNPRTQYPRPPFPRQQIPWPGLTSQMKPRPDHGEDTYVGSGRLAGRRALITGGDSGIGRATAIAFAREGADVAINYLPVEEPDAKEVVALIRKAGRKAVAIPGDLRDEAFCNRLVEQAVEQLGGLDILVNNAARQTAKKSILEITTEQFDSTFKTNIYAMFWLSKAAIPHMKPGASIINTASIVAADPPESLLDYSSTKGAVVVFTKGLAKQLAQKGIRVNAVAPGPYWTPLQPSGGQLPDQLPQFGANTPMGRPGQPGEIAPLYVMLASQEASYTTGNVFSSTGGRGDA